MRATRLNHVSVQALDLEDSKRFYVEVFGMKVLPTPNFGFPVVWLELGDLQLHLFETNSPQGGNHHFGMEVDEFDEAYRRLKERGIFGGGGGYFSHMWEMPDGGVQMYFRDPAGNLVEIDHPNLAQFDRALFGDDLRDMHEVGEQTPENLRATLWTTLRAGERAGA